MFDRNNPETTRQAIEAILAAAKAQSQLVEDLLDVSRITTGKLRLEIAPMDFAEAVDDAVQTMVPAAAAKKIDVERRVAPALVLGDRGRLHQVVWNLLSNAMKFTPDGGRIEIALEVHGSRAILTVKDTGQGIAPEFLSSVFERFSQADAGAGSNRSGGGLGLGLAIVRHIVELHGGEVTAESEGLGKGATFRVMLPIAG
jgi:signal transduction histidine kinase